MSDSQELEAAYARLRVMFTAEIPHEQDRVATGTLAWRLLFFEDDHQEMHRGWCALDPCGCDAKILVDKAALGALARGLDPSE